MIDEAIWCVLIIAVAMVIVEIGSAKIGWKAMRATASMQLEHDRERLAFERKKAEDDEKVRAQALAQAMHMLNGLTAQAGGPFGMPRADPQPKN
ncbi:MAG: hypothetical protein K0V04_16140 [Deltaproteobacteria bacterium]|nr:hypothetical protein [Deltaproteobacteria bacterium]